MPAAAAGALKWVVYVLRCRDGTFYTGITTDIDRRLEVHNAGKGARYTRSRLPVRLAACSGLMIYGEALRVERAVKRLPRGEKVEAVNSYLGTGGRLV